MMQLKHNKEKLQSLQNEEVRHKPEGRAWYGESGVPLVRDTAGLYLLRIH